MPQSDPLQIQLLHDCWATTQLLTACERLPLEQFHRPFNIGPGSLHNTLTHMIAAMRAWTESLAHQEPTPRLDADSQQRTPAQLLPLHHQACEAFTAQSSRSPLDEIITRHLRNGSTIHITRGAALMQVTTHGMHHRAQCLNMLRQLGVSPLPPSSVAEWTHLADK